MGLVCSYLLFAGCLSAPADAAARVAGERFEFAQVHMGTTFRLIFYAAHRDSANAAAAAAFARVAVIDARLSNYLPDSELNRLCRTAGSGRRVPLSDDMYHVLKAAQELALQTSGAFDVTVGPYTKLWRRARRRKQLPTAEQRERAAAAVGFQHLSLDHSTRTATLLQPHMQIDLGGIAKGYAADQARQELARLGIPRALVDASGDIALGDPPPGRPGWRIALTALDQANGSGRMLMLSQAAVATSGDAWQHVTIDGRRYSHIVDPSTGLGLTTPRTVTVIAPHAMLADSLASALSVLGPAQGIKLLKHFPPASALFVQSTDRGIVVAQSRGFPPPLAED